MKSRILKIIVFFIAVSSAQACSAVRDDSGAAAMYNEKGVKALADGAVTAAISYLEQAYKISPSDPTIRKNLAVAYTSQGYIEYDRKNLTVAQRYFETALQLDPEDINAMVFLGDIKYLFQKMDEAKALWKNVLDVAPDYKYKDKVQERLAKLQKEEKVEKEFRSSGMDQFDIRYSREGARLSYNVRYYLQEAYRLLGQDFDCRPKYTIVVLISDREQFDSVGDWPATTQGIYDGKIRLPIIDADYTPDHIRGLVWHEYTHLIVEDLSNGKAPLWLNEGLAYYEGYKYMNKRLKMLKDAVKEGSLIPLKDLESFIEDNKNHEQYWLACQEAYTIANYMMKRYNKYTIREILKSIGEGETFESVAKKKLNITMKEFEKRWLSELKGGELY